MAACLYTKIDIAIDSFGAKRLRAGSALEEIRRGRRGSAGSALLEHRQSGRHSAGSGFESALGAEMTAPLEFFFRSNSE